MAIASRWHWDIVEWWHPNGFRVRHARVFRATPKSTVSSMRPDSRWFLFDWAVFENRINWPTGAGFSLISRSNTWPLPRPENYTEPEDSGSNKCSNQQLANSKCCQEKLTSIPYMLKSYASHIIISKIVPNHKVEFLTNRQKKNVKYLNVHNSHSYRRQHIRRERKKNM